MGLDMKILAIRRNMYINRKIRKEMQRIDATDSAKLFKVF